MTVQAVLEGPRREGIGDLSFASVDSFLCWSLLLLEEGSNSSTGDRGEEIAVFVFEAIADIHCQRP